MPIARINGLDIYYRTTGAGERVVLTHGSWTNADTWQALTPLLADRYEVVVWDRRGHSRSQDGGGPGSLKEDAADLAALIEHLGGDPVHLVGNSSGGAIVLNLLAARPDLARSASAHEPGAFALLEGIEDELLAEEKAGEVRVRDLIEAGENREAARYFVDELAIGPGAWEVFSPELQDTLVANAHTVLTDMEEAYLAESIDIDSLGANRTPLLLTIGADSSEILVLSTRRLADRIPAELHEIAGTGHVPHRSHTDAYAAVLVDFLARSMSAL